MIVPIFEIEAATDDPTVSAGSGRRCVTPDDERRRARRLDVDPGAVGLPAQRQRGDADDRPVDRRVDVRARSGSHVERRRARAFLAAEHVVRQPALAAAEELPGDSRQETLVRLPPDRLERERAVPDRVVADRGHPVLSDRKLQPQRAAQRHDLRARLARRQEPVGGSRAGLGRRGRAGSEGGEHERDEQRDGNRDQTGDAPGSSSRCCSSLRRAARLPGGTGRRHARHRNRCLLVMQKGSSCTTLQERQPGRRRRFLPELGRLERERAVLERGPVPGRRPESQNTGGTMAPMPAGAPTIQIPRWIQLVGVPIARADRAPDRREGLSRGLPLPRRRADRAAARSAGARPGEALDSARVVYCDRLPQLCRRAGRRRVRHRLDRRRPDGIGCQSDRRLPYDRERTALRRPDSSRTSTAYSTGSTRITWSESTSRSRARTSPTASRARTSRSTRRR